jgi:hypothetical protein
MAVILVEGISSHAWKTKKLETPRLFQSGARRNAEIAE